MAVLELDYMEYANDAAAQSAYPSSGVVVDVYDNGYQGAYSTYKKILGETGTGERVAQGFKVGAGITCSKVILKLKKQGSPNDNIVVRIETDSGEDPSGSLVHANATKSLVASTIPTESTEITFEFANTFSLNGNTQYHIVLCRSGARDEDNHIRWDNMTYIGTYPDGRSKRRDSGTWTITIPTEYTNDFWFKVYKRVDSIQCYSEDTIKEQGSYSLKGVAKQTHSLNEYLERTIGSPIDLSGRPAISFDIRASRSGANIKIAIRDSGEVWSEKTYTVQAANTWETVIWGISGVADANKDAIDRIKITIVNADADNTFYIDNIHAESIGTIKLASPQGDITGVGTSWSGNVAEGDFLIMQTDHDSTNEFDTDWVEIAGVTSDTVLTLVDNYKGDTSRGDYTIRKVYSVPSGERWTYAIVDDKFCFTNGNVNVQYYDGATTGELYAALARRARYCLAYANRLFLADFYIESTRYPFSIRWSKEGDPTDWTDNTAGYAEFIESSDFITNLGKVGPNIIVYMHDSYKVGHRTAEPKAPVFFSQTITNVGLVAPYSLVHARGSNIFLGQDDFYRIDSSEPIPIGEAIRHEFFSLVGETEIENTYGYSNTLQDEVRWFATDVNANRICVVWNYKDNKWSYYDYNDSMLSGGRGEV